jgi:heme a synthase
MKTDSSPTDTARASSDRASLPGLALARRGMTYVQPLHVRRLADVTAVGMFLVYAMGTLVTSTGSGHGCGKSWPLCNGRFVPEFAVSTAIEFSHRFVTGIITFLVIGLAAGVWWFWRARLEIRILAPVMVVALFGEALLGALLVLAKTSAFVLALHFGSSLILFSSVLLTALIVRGLDGADGADRLRDQGAPAGLRWLAFALAGYTYVVGYLGAYLRFRGVELACGDWPLCNGSAFPGFAGAMGLVFTHRLAALLLLVGTGALFVWARRLRGQRPDLVRGAAWALGLVLAQAVVGALVVFSQLSLFSKLAHAGLLALLFGALAYVCLQTLPRPAAARSAPISSMRGDLTGAKAAPATPAART